MKYNLFNLRRVLDEGHPVTGAYSTNDTVARGQINEANIAVNVILTSANLLAWAAKAGRLGRLQTAAGGVVPNSGSLPDGLTDEIVISVAASAYILIQREGAELDLSMPDRQQVLGVLEAGGVLASDEVVELYTLASGSPISHAQSLNWPEVPVRAIIDARNGVVPVGNMVLDNDNEVAALIHTTEEGPQPVEYYGVSDNNIAVNGSLPDLVAKISGLHEKDTWTVVFEPRVNFDPNEPNKPSKIADKKLDNGWDFGNSELFGV